MNGQRSASSSALGGWSVGSTSNPNGTMTPDGMQFGPTKSGKRYLCANWHRGRGDGQHKTCWIIEHEAEFLIFCDADENEWKDEAPGNYWGIRRDSEPIGENEERVAKFPVPQNDDDPWHGYPVFTGDNGSKPPKPILDRWKSMEYISRSLQKRILKGQV